MATITRRDHRPAEQRWQATIRRKGFPTQCKSFPSKADAEAWARSVESEMQRGLFVDYSKAKDVTLGELLARYRDEVSPTKKGGAEERQRINAMLRWPISQYAAINVTPAVLSRLRDDRLEEVSGSTVNRDFNLLSHVFTTAMIEWGISLPINPVSRVRRPKENKPRNRRIEGDEDVRLLEQCRQAHNKLVYPAVLALLDTGMRRSEVVGVLLTCPQLSNPF